LPVRGRQETVMRIWPRYRNRRCNAQESNTQENEYSRTACHCFTRGKASRQRWMNEGMMKRTIKIGQLVYLNIVIAIMLGIGVNVLTYFHNDKSITVQDQILLCISLYVLLLIPYKLLRDLIPGVCPNCRTRTLLIDLYNRRGGAFMRYRWCRNCLRDFCRMPWTEWEEAPR